MSFCYDKLWKLLIDHEMNKTDLQKKIGTTPATIAKMGRNETVSLQTLGKICETFNCDLSDIVEYRQEEHSE
ncbi:helix-turn-helix domain-containing protein [Hutsoniella sourekii]|uniref:helix-turn-helix domain-containing protein n=1 Tax=Hutsoniella sourekii TaxID=87650 RepID=UPI000487DA01|nr:helix-turn-helix transcriptional regulator [Hutsoniella sourekii]